MYNPLTLTYERIILPTLFNVAEAMHQIKKRGAPQNASKRLLMSNFVGPSVRVTAQGTTDPIQQNTAGET